MSAQSRKQAFDKLPPNTIPWEQFKRMVGFFGIEKATEKAIKMTEEQPLTKEQKEVATLAIKNALVFGTSTVRATQEQLEMHGLPRLTDKQIVGDEFLALNQQQEVALS